jgi:hypothetical protein
MPRVTFAVSPLLRSASELDWSFPADPLLAPSFAQPPKSALYGQLNLSPEEEERTITLECWHLELHTPSEQSR